LECAKDLQRILIHWKFLEAAYGRRYFWMSVSSVIHGNFVDFSRHFLLDGMWDCTLFELEEIGKEVVICYRLTYHGEKQLFTALTNVQIESIPNTG
jgi:hypothetical protein